MSIDKISPRLATADDQAFIDDMNVVASYRGKRPDAQLLPAAEFFSIVPHAAPYSENFGRDGDIGVVLRDDIRDEDVAAIWGREYVRTEDDGVLLDHPFEITIGVRESYRGQGLGLQLLGTMAALAWHAGRDEISLGVHEDSPNVRRLYETAGYVALQGPDGSEPRVADVFIPMIKRL